MKANLPNCQTAEQIRTHTKLSSRPDIGASYIPESSEGLAAVDELIIFAVNITNTGSVTVSSIELLSPAGRPIQRTADLPGFWDGSWAEVRKDMAGRYPKHNWPKDPR